MEKITLPTKTKIAAWWMRVIGIGTIFLTAGVYLVLPLEALHSFFFEFISKMFYFSFLLIIFSFFLFKKRRWAWILSILLLLSLTIFITWSIINYAKYLQYARSEFIRIAKEVGLTLEEISKDVRYKVGPEKALKGIILYFVCLPLFILFLLDRKNFSKLPLKEILLG